MKSVLRDGEREIAMIEYKSVVDEKRRAKLEVEGRMISLLVCNNGYQYSAITMYSIEVVRAARDLLNMYLADEEARGNGDD